ncbi:esterase/lipase family protein [Leifsonia sp. NPDC058292]|uniref:esterase/lipase family protein n=1 Tax=Leifsonia sp. NPDC058292 TaxID=3346428 RepID=UPI0036D93DE4
MRQLLRMAGVWALDYLYVVRHQVRAAFSRSDPDVLVAHGQGPPVVLLPGIYETWRFLLPLARHIHGLGHPVHVVAALGRNRTTIADGAALVAEYLEARQLHDVTIVAHSKGGLIAKHLMGLPGRGERVRTTIAVSTPFAGSAYARFIPIRSVRALAPSNTVMQQLARERAANERIVSVYGWFDPHIPGGCDLAGARNVRLAVGGHFRILASKDLLEVVDAVLAGDDPARDSVGGIP